VPRKWLLQRHIYGCLRRSAEACATALLRSKQRINKPAHFAGEIGSKAAEKAGLIVAVRAAGIC
jgi:hypothetical protein